MIHDLKPYPNYKDSGVPWLGQVPVHWDLRSLGSLTYAISLRGRPDLPLLSVVREKGVITRSTTGNEENHNFIPDDLSNYKVVRTGNLVINKMKAWQGSLGVAQTDGIVSPAYFVFDFEIEDRRFGHALLRSNTYVGFFARASDGVRIGQWDLSVDGMKRIPVVVPSGPEQSAIVRFLDHADRRIRRYIGAKKKLIALLNEKKQAIIHHAVTRGLDSSVRLKPSGVGWLGEVPEHWALKRVHGAFQERNQKGRPDLPILVVSIAEGVTVGSELDVDGRPRRLIEDRALYKVARKGDIAYNMMRMWQGAIGVVPEDGLVSPAYVVARPYGGMNAAYYTLLFRTSSCKGDIVSRSRGIVDDRNRLYWEGFKALRVPVPPLLEQNLIVKAITAEAQAVERSIAVIQGEVNLLHEYRTRLIADVVTGKLDVREAAARLPEAGVPELLAEDEEMGEDEAEGEGAHLDALSEEATA